MKDIESIIFKRSKRKDILFFLLCFGFVLIGMSLIEKSPFKGWCGIVFFGIGSLLFFVELVTNISYLKLDKMGFEQRNLFKTINFNWSDVNKFEIRSFRGNKSILFEHRDKFGNLKWKSISTSYTIKTKDLVDLMRYHKMKNKKH